jgi:hypothetical protein
MTDFLRPKASAPARTRKMENGIFRNPPTYSVLGGFTSEQKLTDPTGKRNKIGGMGLERGGPSAQRGKPI